MFVNCFGAPRKIVSDRGTAFTSNNFTEFCQKHGISHTLNLSQHSRANSQVERLNETILRAIQVNCSNLDGKH